MLADDRIIFALHHFLGEIARIFAGYIEKAGVRGADESDLYIGWFRHGAFLRAEAEIKTATQSGAAFVKRANGENAARCQEKAFRPSLPAKWAAFTTFKPCFCMISPKQGPIAMNHDINLFVQAEMRNLLDNLPAELAGQHPLQFLMHLDHIRQKATEHRLSALRDLSCALESALQPAMRHGGARTIARSYLEAMRASLDCGELDPSMIEALMANVALRLGGQL